MTASRVGTLAAFSSRDFRLLWGGQAISFTGDAAFIVALGWRVTELTGKVGTLGFVLAFESLAMLVTLLLGGVLADRYPRARLMIGSDLVRAAVLAVFLTIDLSGHLTLGFVIGLAVVFGAADGFFQPAFGGIVPLVVEQPMLASANSWLGIARNGSAVVGPAIAALLYGTTGPSAVWAIECISFLVSAAMLSAARPRRIEPAAREGIGRELAIGFRYVISVPWIWTGIAAAAVILMLAMAPFTALMPAWSRTTTTAESAAYGADLQRPCRRDGRRLARVGEMASEAAPGDRLLRRVRHQRPRDRRARARRIGTRSGLPPPCGAGSGSALGSRRG